MEKEEYKIHMGGLIAVGGSIMVLTIISVTAAFHFKDQSEDLLLQRDKALISRKVEIAKRDSLISILRKYTKESGLSGGGTGGPVLTTPRTIGGVSFDEATSGTQLVTGWEEVKKNDHKSLKYRIYRIQRDDDVKNEELSEILMEIVSEIEKLEKR